MSCKDKPRDWSLTVSSLRQQSREACSAAKTINRGRRRIIKVNMISLKARGESLIVSDVGDNVGGLLHLLGLLAVLQTPPLVVGRLGPDLHQVVLQVGTRISS